MLGSIALHLKGCDCLFRADTLSGEIRDPGGMPQYHLHWGEFIHQTIVCKRTHDAMTNYWQVRTEEQKQIIILLRFCQVFRMEYCSIISNYTPSYPKDNYNNYRISEDISMY